MTSVTSGKSGALVCRRVHLNGCVRRQERRDKSVLETTVLVTVPAAGKKKKKGHTSGRPGLF